MSERHYLTVISWQKIVGSNTYINGVYKYEFIFLFEDHFLKFVILGFSVLLVPYMITFQPYQSQKICNH